MIVFPPGRVRYKERWPRPGFAEARHTSPAMRTGGCGVPLLVIRRMNAAAAASLCSTDASVPDGVT
jgi:hypothetical protein